MNKNELVAAVAQATDTSNGNAAKAVDGVFDAIASALETGDDVQLVGFGSC